MSTLPRILVIDDAYGAARQGRNRDRRNFCFRAGLQDVTGDLQAEKIQHPVAEAVFHSGQRMVNGRIENDPEAVLKAVRAGLVAAPRWALVLLDLHFKTGNMTQGEVAGRDADRDPQQYFGLELLRAIRNEEVLAGLPVVILSAMSRQEIEARFSELGAADFQDKSTLSPERLAELLFEHGLLEDDRLIGSSISFLRCLREARRRSIRGDDNILVLGETGTGKELLANYIHRQSGRKGPYVPLFTQGVPETLVEDRLFGHEKGAFAGATQAVAGAAEQADGGTLFIDEFGDIPAAVQGKMLRLLDRNTREVQRIGATQAKRLDLQVVMATNDVETLRSDAFRRDLTQRVKLQNPVVLPPLRERREDIPALVEHFLRKHEEKLDAQRRVVVDEAMQLLCRYDWPGNIRELERVIEHAVCDYRGLKVMARSHLSIEVTEASPPESPSGKEAQIPPVETASSGSENELDTLFATIEEISNESLDAAQLNGALVRWRRTEARVAALLLRAALSRNVRCTPSDPAGKVLIQPAMQLLTGNPELTGTKAKRIVKRMLEISPEEIEDLLADPLLAAAAKRVGLKHTNGARKGTAESD